MYLAQTVCCTRRFSRHTTRLHQPSSRGGAPCSRECELLLVLLLSPSSEPDQQDAQTRSPSPAGTGKTHVGTIARGLLKIPLWSSGSVNGVLSHVQSMIGYVCCHRTRVRGLPRCSPTSNFPDSLQWTALRRFLSPRTSRLVPRLRNQQDTQERYASLTFTAVVKQPLLLQTLFSNVAFSGPLQWAAPRPFH